jgi:Putative  PD-(D/E)XK family member, (DUF4420)
MMSDRSQWSPSVASRIAALRGHLAHSEDDLAEALVPDVQVPCYVGSNREGDLWLRIVCEPDSVITDDLAAAVRFTVLRDGYRVAVGSNVPESIAARFLEEIIQLVQDGHAAGDAGRTALQHWRELIAEPVGSPLSDEALAGLFGELEVLETVLEYGGTLGHWTGWTKDQNDFRLPSLVLEVKTTMSANYRRVRIHGLRQLAVPEDGSELVLVLRRLEASPGGRSVPDLTDALVGGGAPRAKLLECLSKVHYSEQHRALYEHRKFVSQEVALRRVDDSHPRLTPEILRPIDLAHIDKVDYELNLNDDVADLDTPLDALIEQALGR